MEESEEPLDFEFEDPLDTLPVITTKKKKKVIGLDDLLSDYYKEQSKVKERESKRAKKKKKYDSDDELDEKEVKFSKCVDQFQKEIAQIGDDDDISLWGLEVFGHQKTLPRVVFGDPMTCSLWQSFLCNELNSLVKLEKEKGESFLEGLLASGWLLKLVNNCGLVEKSIATWTFNLMLYSSNEALRTYACEFWCGILSYKNEDELVSFKIEWLPSYLEIKGALKIYGFRLDLPPISSVYMEMDHADSDTLGPPQNIRCWITFVGVCCRARHMHKIFSVSDAEDVACLIICLFLDRQLLGLSTILCESLQSVISFFSDYEWTTSCKNLARSLASRLPRDINCLRAVESISGVNKRLRHLRSEVAFQFLLLCFDDKVVKADEVLNLLLSINVKDKTCDPFKMYIYLGLAENWLLSDQKLRDDPLLREIWGACLRNFSCQITSTDLRSYASKVRSKASYLLQSCAN